MAALLLVACGGPSADGVWMDRPPGGAEPFTIRFSLEESRGGEIRGDGALEGRALTITGQRRRTSVLLDIAIEGADSAGFQGGLVGDDELYGYLSMRRRGEAVRLFRQQRPEGLAAVARPVDKLEVRPPHAPGRTRSDPPRVVEVEGVTPPCASRPSLSLGITHPRASASPDAS
jgi:hypothetical protein